MKIKISQNLIPKIKWRLRFLNANFRALPDFLIIGAQKGGTTSLWDYLLQHPQVLSNYDNRKEIQFFDQKFKKGLYWYKAHFETQKFIREKKEVFNGGNILTGEATTHYIFHPLAPKRIKSILPNVKIIVLLRNPVSRAYSHYHHEVRKHRENLSFKEAIKFEPMRLKGSYEKILANPNFFCKERHDHSYLERGKYYDQLVHWYYCFPKNQILVLKSEDFFNKPETIYKIVLNFLELPYYEGVKFNKINQGTYENIEPALAKQLQNYFYNHNKNLYQLLKIEF